MNLVRLIYSSKVSNTCTFEGLRSIFQSAYKNNPALGITGVLCYDPHYFLQWLEGPVETVHNLYASILQDGRHSEPKLIDNSEVSKPLFPNWTMAYLSTQVADRQLMHRYTHGQPFNPMLFDAPTASEFLIKLAVSKGQPLDPVIVRHPDIAVAVQ